MTSRSARPWRPRPASPGGFPPIQVRGIVKDYLVELVDGGVHDNQGIEGLVDRGCTHMIISDGSGQMPDRVRPSIRLPAVLSRVISIYGDAEREQRLLGALQTPESVAFVHLQTGLPAPTRTPAGKVTQEEAPIETAEFGVDLDVQRALANIRTDLDAFCDVEAWSLMADGYQLTDRIVPSRAGVAGFGAPGPQLGWPFAEVAARLWSPDDAFLNVLRVAKERYLKPARLVDHAFAVANVVTAIVVAAACVALWLVLPEHGAILYIAGLATVAGIVAYFLSDKPYVKPVAIVVFDVIAPALLAIPLLVYAALQLAVGRLWRRLGSVERLP